MRALASQELNPMIIPPDILKNILHVIETDIKSHARLKLCEDPDTNIWSYYGTIKLTPIVLDLATVMDGMFITLPTALDVRLCLITNGHLCMFNQVLYPVEHMTWCSYALFINNKEQIEKNCLLKTINHTTNLAYSLDGYLWAICALAAEKHQIRCVMETHVITIKPPLQIVDMGNRCEAYSTSIYIPAKSELTAIHNMFPILSQL